MKLRRHIRGFSIVEVLMVIVIMALIGTMAFPLYSTLRKRAYFVSCVGNLRILHVGLSGYMLDHNMVWPQVNSESFEQGHQEYEAWVATLKPYGVSERNWLCPGDVESSDDSKKGGDDSDLTGSYVVTQFDEFPNTAFRWSQPWVLETGAFHGTGQGLNILMPDGSVHQSPSLFSAK